MKISFFQRKRRPNQNYSLEFIFQDVRSRLPEDMQKEIHISKYQSNGVWKRIYNMIEASLKQTDVNHVTGDVNFLSILLKPNKSILTILDCRFMTIGTPLRKKIINFFWLTLPIKRVKFVTVISTATKNEVLKFVNCQSAKIRVIPVAISPEFIYTPKIFNKDKPIILQIGTAPNKNLSRLIEAIVHIPCKLQILGKISEETKQKLREYKIDYDVKWNLPFPEVKNLYKTCDLLVFASTYEGFGMPILESNATGRPVVTSNLSSMPEVAGNAAVLVDPYDKSSIQSGILKIIEDDIFRENLIKKGLDNVKRFDPQKIAEMYINIYKEVYEGN